MSAAPPLEENTDLDAHVRLLPPDAMARGMYFQDVLRRLTKRFPTEDVEARVGLPKRRYLPFQWYPYEDYLRLCSGAAPLLWPTKTQAQALRALGNTAYDTFLDSHVGAVVLGMFGRSFGTIVKASGKAWGVSVSFGKVSAEEIAPRHVRLEFRDLPGFLGTLQTGVVEGGMKATGVVGEVSPKVHTLGSMTLDVRWTDA